MSYVTESLQSRILKQNIKYVKDVEKSYFSIHTIDTIYLFAMYHREKEELASYIKVECTV